MAECQCGCGEEVAIAKRSNRALGHVKGQPVRFVLGHRKSPSLRERFDAKVTRRGPAECWPWSAGRIPEGYGALWDRKRGNNRLAHRLAWEFAYGSIPPGMFVCHRCDNPPCCNPAHLFLGTQADNDADRTDKGRSSRGTRHPDSKLTPDSVREIRLRVSDGERQADLAREFGVSKTTLSQMIHGKTWRHIT